MTPQQETIYKAGLDYINRNLSILPTGKNKQPLVSWKIFQTTRSTKKDLDFWINFFPDMQLGIVTGKISNLIVVDVDDPNMDLSWLPETAIIKTGSGGFHYYYQYVNGFSNKVRIKEKIDIRSDAGFVVAPPSFNEKGQYIILKPMKCQPFPIHLFQETTEKNYTAVQTSYPGYGEGQRNDEMTKFVGHILAKVHPSEWESLAWTTICNANEKNNPPLSTNELRIIFSSIVSRERNNSADRWYKKTEVKIPQTVRLKVKENYKDRYTWGTRGLDTSLAVIKRGNFIILAAKRSSGKSTWSFDMACKNALLGHRVLYISLEMEENSIKEDFARKYAGITVEEEYDYAIPENKQKSFEKKIAEINAISNLFFRGMRRGSSVKWEAIVELINEFDDLDLIFIDNLDLIEGDLRENDLERQKRVTKNIMSLTAEKKIPIILIHHHRKSQTNGKDYGADELAGSGKIGDNADIILKITRNTTPDAVYPDKYRSRIFQQKGRGYSETSRIVYFIRGTFVDEAPQLDQYDGYTASLYETGNMIGEPEIVVEENLEENTAEQKPFFWQKD